MWAFHCDRFDPGLPPGHRFPMEKYQRLRALVAQTLPEVTLCEAPAAEARQLSLVHAPAYVQGVLEGSLPEAAWREIGFPWSPMMVERSLRSVGATLAATARAIEDGVALNLAGGTHHASRDKGSGFCVFNDVAVAIGVWRARQGGRGRVAVIDLDVHQGNGTAEIFAGDGDVFTLSLHGERNFPFRKAASTLDVGLPDDCGDDDYLTALDQALRTLSAAHEQQPFGLVFYLAGADAHEGDRLGHLSLTDDGMCCRDEAVLRATRRWRLPTVVCMAGGYGRDLDAMLAVQLRTVRASWEDFLLRRHDRAAKA